MSYVIAKYGSLTRLMLEFSCVANSASPFLDWSSVFLGAELTLCDSTEPFFHEIREALHVSELHWRLRLVVALFAVEPFLNMSDASQPIVAGDIYEFGTNDGAATNLLRRMFPKRKIWGFDSYRGLPRETPGLETLQEWSEGKFAVHDEVKTARHIIESLGGPALIDLLVGFFNETLKPHVAPSRGMQPALYVDVDVDLYVSASQALTWLFESGLIRPGTFIGYDDWWTLTCAQGEDVHHPFSSGEGRAHLEIAARFGVSFVCAAGPCALPVQGPARTCGLFGGSAPIFLVESIAGEKKAQVGARWDHGFRIDDIERFRWDSDFCAELKRVHHRISAAH